MKRILASLLALVMLVSCLGVTAYAEASEPTVWNGSVDIRWFQSNSKATEYTINTAEELAGLAAAVNAGNDFAKVTFKLNADITLNSGNAASWSLQAPANEWTPIGNNANAFKGVFDGQGHTISGMYVNIESGSTEDQAGLFGALTSTSGDNYTPAVRNLSVVNSYVKTSTARKAGLVVGQVYTAQMDVTISLENLRVEGIVVADQTKQTAKADLDVGGVCGVATINNASSSLVVRNVYADVKASEQSTDKWSSAAGGLVGFVDSKGSVVIENSFVNGNVASNRLQAGGILGFAKGTGKVTVSNCMSVGEVSSPARSASGVIAYSDCSVKVENCVTNVALVGGTATDPIGPSEKGTSALVAYTNCYAVATASGEHYTAVSANDIKGANALATLGASFTGWVTTENGYAMPKGAAVMAGEIELPALRLAAVQETAVADGKIAVRLIGAMNSKSYKSVGFQVKIGDNTADKGVTSILSSVVYGSGEDAGSYTAADYYASYIYGVILPEVSATGTVTVEATPYTVAEDDTKTVSATTWVITYVDGVFSGVTTK